ncbi:TorF family putative porin [Erythrobacter sp. YT30]|uniref:TorF family putative porin n=1 Tax=Erythrobacter sp. YT30 TaxID=1735012 RepID=UPI00076CF963|nr:TorF family putative porin [Erythrobacter sp. YT30]KWV92426.1 hypothetical protein AUC45_13705 [Erythrobacter sp. YT30]
MLTSIRSPLAASITIGVLLSSAPALAGNTEVSSSVDAGESISLEHSDIQIIDLPVANEGSATLLDPSIDWSAQSAAAARANGPVDEEAASSLGEETGISFSANVALTTEYRFRGINLSGGELAIQGGFDVSHTSGLYAGVWASNLDEDTVGYGSIELDIYGGWSGNLTEGLTGDVGFIAYTYPDASGINTVVPGNFDYYEGYASLGFSLGPVSSTVGVAYAPGQVGLDFGGERDNLYVYTDLSASIPDTPLTLNAHLGYTDGSLTFTNDSKAFDWSVGVDVAVGPATLSAAYIDVEGDAINDPGGVFTDDAFVVTLSASF